MILLFLAELRRRWPEHLAGALVIALLVGAVVALRATTAHLDDSIHGAAHLLGKNMLVLPASMDIADYHEQRFGGLGMPQANREALLASPVAEHVRALQARLYGKVKVGGKELLLVGDDGPWAPVGDGVPAVLGTEAARRIGAAPGSQLEVGGKRLVVLGVEPSGPDGLDDAVFVPLPIAQEVLGRPGEITSLRLAGCWCRIDVAALGREVERFLPGTRAITVAGMLAAQQGVIAATRRYGRLLEVGAGALTAALVGLLSSSRARRRSRELGLAAAIGARPLAIAGLFGVEAAIAGGLGALAGYGLASVATPLATSRLAGAAVTPTLELLPWTLGTTVLLCLAAALVPAVRAAARDPIAVLREGAP